MPLMLNGNLRNCALGYERWWPLEGGSGRGSKYNINSGSVLMCGLFKDIFGRSDCTVLKKVIAKTAGGVVDGLILTV
jgi:hypothetical protein